MCDDPRRAFAHGHHRRLWVGADDGYHAVGRTDMTTYKAWLPPPGNVVKPPVHPKTWVSVLYSDGQFSMTDYEAGDLNWSSVGDGPRVVAYAVVEECKSELREFWIVGECEAYDSKQEAIAGAASIFGEQPIVHVREVTDPSREVVAWAVVRDGQRLLLTHNEIAAGQYADKHGGTVVKLTGVMP